MNIKSWLKSTLTRLKRIGRGTGEWMAKSLRHPMSELRGRSKQISGKISLIGKHIVQNWELLSYYAVLAIVLIALGMAAYDYRTQGVQVRTLRPTAQPELEPAAVVQSQPDPTLSPESDVPEWIMPVNGEIVGAFSADELNWSTTMQMWQTHPAIDIAASAGEAVVAAASGTVLEAYCDVLYGNTIAIDHGDGRILRYSSLNTLQLVTVGEQVDQGEVISAVGTCTVESDLGAHVHLEYYVNQEAEDFSLLLK